MQNICEYKKIIDGYKRECDCVPSYLINHYILKSDNTTKPCTFFQHATCIASLQTDTEHRARLNANRCHPKCDYTKIEIESVKHVELNSEHLNFVRETVNLPKNIDLISSLISL